ncbi:hypothetical protein JCM11491_006711 [Sporobolomyces phaffii]
MNLMERRQASWSKRSAANKAHPALSASTFEPLGAPGISSRPSLARSNSVPVGNPLKDTVDVRTGNFDISPDFTSSPFDPLPLANTPLAHTPLPQSESNNSIETTTSHFTDARTDFSSPTLSRSAATSPLDEPPRSSPTRDTSDLTPRALSAAALAASTEPSARPPSFSRPPLPPKSSARNSLADSRRSTVSEVSSRSRANSAGFDENAGGERSVRKVPSFTMTPPQRNSDATPTSTSTAGLATASMDLSCPRPRPSLPSASTRTPTLSQADSTASSRFSLASEISSGLRNSELFQSPEMTEEGYGYRTSSVAESEQSKFRSDGATPYSTDNDESSTSLPTPEIPPAARPRSESRPVGIATLHLDTSSMERHPSPPTGMPPTAALAGLAGLGIGWEEGDLQSNLDELSRYAQTLPSPLPSPHPRQDIESPLDRWKGGERGTAASEQESALLVPSTSSALPPVPPLPNLDSPTVPLTPSSRPRARSRSASRTRQPMKKPSLVDLAASSSSSPYFGGRSGKSRTEPPPLPAPPRREREWSSTHDSESYLSMDDTDFLSTDDEDGSRSFGKMRFQSFAHSADQSIASSNDGASAYYGVGARTSGTYPPGSLGGATNFSTLATMRGTATPDLGDALWNSDLVRVMVDDDDDDKIIHGILDWSGRAIEMAEVPASTTHLILARTQTPLLVAPLLNVTIPNLSQGLVVLDISSCGLTEVPSAIASCTGLEELDIHGNPLASGTLPSFLGAIPSLFVLIADGCGLSSLPSSLSHLSRLHTLAVRDNRLRALPSWFSRLSSLEVLLIDGNPLHWQYLNLVRPLLTALTDSPEQSQHRPPSRAASPLPANLSPSSHSVPTSRARSPSGPYPHSNSSSFSIPPNLADSPTVGAFSLVSPRPGTLPSSAPPQQSSFVELSPPPPPGSSDRDDQTLSSPATVVPSPDPSAFVDGSVNGGGAGITPKKSWGRLFKKVSSSRMNLKRPGALEPETRTFSEPVTRTEGSQAEEKSGGLFGSRRTFRKKTTRPPIPQALAALSDPSTPNSSKRRSFLVLDAFKSPGDHGSVHQLASSSPQTHQVALRSVLAYLRDLDDLSENLSLPNIPLDSPSPPLRHSPSLGTLSPTPSRVDSPDVRRAQSTRRPLPSRASRPNSSSRLSDYYDDSPDPSSSGRGTPLPGGSFSPLPGTVGAASAGHTKTKNDPARREAVIREIVDTEQTYLRGLEELCAIYVASSAKTISSNGGRKDPVLPLAERRAVFGNIEAIRDFHGTIFLPDLVAAVRAGGDSTVVAARVGEVFRQHGSFLKIYSAYVNGFDASLAQIQTWAAASTSGRPSTASGTSVGGGGTSSTLFDAASQIGSTLTQSQKKRIKSWMKRCRAHPSHSQISLESYLLLPVQRIPRYRLLLESLLACTPAPASDSLAPPTAFLAPDAQPAPPHPTILAAVLEMDLVATTLNESKRETEGRAQLLMWQGRIVNRYKSSLVQPHRTLLRSGKLVLTRSVKRSTTTVDPLPAAGPSPPSSHDPAARAARSPSPAATAHFLNPAAAAGDEIHTLFTETCTQELIVLLCTDLLILVKAPPAPLDTDPTVPVELYTVVRLNSGAIEAAAAGGGGGGGGSGRKSAATGGGGPVSLFGKDEDMLRIKVGTKAILYLQLPLAPTTTTTATTFEPNLEDAAAARRKRKMEARQWRDAINLQFYINT